MSEIPLHSVRRARRGTNGYAPLDDADARPSHSARPSLSARKNIGSARRKGAARYADAQDDAEAANLLEEETDEGGFPVDDDGDGDDGAHVAAPRASRVRASPRPFCQCRLSDTTLSHTGAVRTLGPLGPRQGQGQVAHDPVPAAG
jgi:hypothetical protein